MCHIQGAPGGKSGMRTCGGLKAMDDGSGWAHDDKNGNFEELTPYAHLVSLMKSSVGINGFYKSLASGTVIARVQLGCFFKNGLLSILGYDVLYQLKKL